MKLGALVFAVELQTFAINLQLLGGIWILQTFPAIVGGLFTRWFHRWALLVGWAAGMVYGTVAAYNVADPTAGTGPVRWTSIFGHTGYIALTAFVLNLVVAVVLTLVFRAAQASRGRGRVQPAGVPGRPSRAPASAPAGVGGVGVAGAAGD